MFPLGSVLLPGMVLPLHVFEDRYRRLVDDVLAAPEPEFGVALIERGSEVGGGDIRAMSACVARVIEAARTEDGRWAIVAVGTDPLEVREWMPDDPYPRARVRRRGPADDAPGVPAAVPDGTEAALGALESRVRRLAALATELGAPSPGELDFSEDPHLRSFQLAVITPLGAHDRYRILCAADLGARVALLTDLVAEQEELLAARLAFGGPDDPGDPGGP